MSAIRLTIDQRSFDRETRKAIRVLEKSRRQAVPQAMAQSLNRTAQRAMTRTRRALAQAKQLPQKVLKKRVQMFKASPRKLVARVWVGVKKHIPIESLPGARFIISGKQAGTLKAGRIISKPFKATLKSGHSGLFVRKAPALRRTAGRPATSSPNLPIEHPVVRLQPEAERIIEHETREQMRAFFPSELRRQVDRRLQKLSVSRG